MQKITLRHLGHIINEEIKSVHITGKCMECNSEPKTTVTFGEHIILNSINLNN